MASFVSSATSYLQPVSRTTVLVSLAAVTATVTLLAATKLLYKRRTTRKNAATVTDLKVYPIKSVSGLSVDHLEIIDSGCKYGNFHDRSMVVLNGEDRMITQRQNEAMARIRSSISGPSQLTLSADSMEDLVIDVNTDPPVDGQRLNFSLWDQATSGFEVSQEASNWFSRFLNEPGARLVKFTTGCKNRPTDCATPQGGNWDEKYKIKYQDGSPLHLGNLATLDALNQLARPEGKSFVMDAFRPNVIVKSPIPGEELTWFSCTIDSVTFCKTRECDRCAIPTVDISTGERDPDKRTIMFNHRSAQNEYEKQNFGKNPLFGLNLAPKNTGRIKVGSSVDVTY